MIHLVFNETDAEVLAQAMALDALLKGDIVVIKEDWSIGPLQQIYTTEGYQQRRAWWEAITRFWGVEQQGFLFEDKQTVFQLIKTLNESPEEQLWIWMAQNAHDVCGYYWLITQLNAFQGRIMILYLNNLPFFNEKGSIFYPLMLSEIPAKEFLKAKKLARAVTFSEFEIDTEEWEKLGAANSAVRLLEGGKKLAGKSANVYDKQLLEGVSHEPHKMARSVQNIRQKYRYIHESFWLHRIHHLIETGYIGLIEAGKKDWKETIIQLLKS